MPMSSTLIQMPPPGGSGPVPDVAPVVLAAVLGVVVIWTPALFLGYPPPAVTYDVLVNGSVVAPGATSGTYLPVTIGASLSVRATATNKAGSAVAVSTPLTVTL